MISRPCDGSTAFDRSEWVNVACDLTQAGSIARPGRRRRARAGERYRASSPSRKGRSSEALAVMALSASAVRSGRIVEFLE